MKRLSHAPGHSNRGLIMWILYLALAALLLYVCLVGAVAISQTRLLFPVQLASNAQLALPASAGHLRIKTADGTVLAGVRIASGLGSNEGAPLLLGFGGNAWNAEAMALYLHRLLPEADIVTFHYRGYPPSTGDPSASALLADALAIYDNVQQEGGRPLVAVGFSIGSGVAAYLAAHRAVAGVILVTPFDSLQALARDHFPWAPVGLLLRHDMPVVDFVTDRSTPTALIAAGRDTIVPPRRTEPLRHAIPNLVLDTTIPDAGHNDLYDHPSFAVAIRDAFTRMRAGADPV
jgi:pimeloyl-ACP methyl ester carboxylesterase